MRSKLHLQIGVVRCTGLLLQRADHHLHLLAGLPHTLDRLPGGLAGQHLVAGSHDVVPRKQERVVRAVLQVGNQVCDGALDTLSCLLCVLVLVRGTNVGISLEVVDCCQDVVKRDQELVPTLHNVSG